MFHKSLTTMVKDCLISKTWCIPLNVQIDFSRLLPLISTIHIPDSDIDDYIIWRESSNGELSMKQAYD